MLENDALAMEGDRVFFYRSRHGEAVYLTWSIRIGFAYRSVFFSNVPHCETLNQGFPQVFAGFIRLRGSRFLGKPVNAVAYRGSVCVSIASTVDEYLQDAELLHQFLFTLDPDETGFLQAKNHAVQSLRKAYQEPMGRGMYHMLEYSDRNKGFLFHRFSEDLQQLSFDDFCKFSGIFAIPDNAWLTLSGYMEFDVNPLPFVLYDMEGSLPDFVLCAEQYTPEKERDVHKILPSSADYEMRCLKFHFPDTDTHVLWRYLLMDIFAAGGLSSDYEVHADLFDACIILWGDEKFPHKSGLAHLLAEPDFV